MELKLLTIGRIVSFYALTFNRTSMELKHVSQWVQPDNALTFNRTSMELKLFWVS